MGWSDVLKEKEEKEKTFAWNTLYRIMRARYFFRVVELIGILLQFYL